MFEFLISTVISYAFGKMADNLLAKNIINKLDKEIVKWIEKIPKEKRPDFATIQDKCKLDVTNGISDDIPQDSPIRVVYGKLQQSLIPSKEEWNAAFLAQWHRVKEVLSNNQRNDFFNLPVLEAKEYFDLLAVEFEMAYQQEGDYAFPTLFAKWEELNQKINRIDVTTQETNDNVKKLIKPDWDKIRQYLTEHSYLVLQAAHTDIKGVHIDRNLDNTIGQILAETQFLLVSGNRGSGKSAAVRKYLESQTENPFSFWLRAEEFNVSNLETLFYNLGIDLSLSDLLNGLSANSQVTVVIESLERILDIERNTFDDFLTLVKGNLNWKIIATCRDYAVDCVQQSFFRLPDIPYKTIDIPDFSDTQFDDLCSQCSALSGYRNSSDSMRKFMHNPFIARIAAQLAPEVAPANNISTFKQAVCTTPGAQGFRCSRWAK